jgi:hypothetical protein
VKASRRGRQPAPNDAAAQPAATGTPAAASHTQAASDTQAAGRRRDLVLLAAAAVVVALAVWRATLGISFFDDGSYVTLPLHFAQGARPFADEMTAQGLGFLLAVPFVKVWTALFGTSALVLASRLFYVVLASGVGYVIYRALRPTFGSWVTAIAVAVVLLAPPYNVMAVSYNTVAVLAFAAATALAWQAVRDGDRRAAAAAGVAAAAGAVSYVSLAPVALALVCTLLVVGWRRRVAPVFLIVLVGAGTLFGCLLLLLVSPHTVAVALRYSSDVWGTNRSLTDRTSVLLTHLRVVLTGRWLIPMWILAVLACVPWFSPRVRVVALALLPLAATVLPAWHHRADRTMFFGRFGTACLVTISAGLLVPVVFWAVHGAVRAHRRAAMDETARDSRSAAAREAGNEPQSAAAREAGNEPHLAAAREAGTDHWPDRWPDALRLLALAAPPALVGFVVVALSTSSGWYRALAFVGLAPLTIVLVAGWGRTVRRDGGRLIFAPAAGALVLVLLVALFASSFKDGASWSLTHRIWHGPLAGIATSDQRAAEIAAVEAQGRRRVRPHDRVLVFNSPLAYVLVGGRMFTNADWLQSGHSDQVTVDYFARKHRTPDVVFLSSGIAARSGGPALTNTNDPLVRFLAAHYRVVESGQLLDVLVRR